MRQWHRAEEGFTLVEILVVILMTGLLVTAAFTLVESMFNADTRSSEQLNERTELTQAAQFLSLGVGPAATGTLGEPCGATYATTCPAGSSVGNIMPATIAGDQLLFTSNKACYRIFYLESSQELYVAPGSTCAQVAPPGATAGPNPEADGSSDPLTSSDAVLQDAIHNSQSPTMSETLFDTAAGSSNLPLEVGVINDQVPFGQNVALLKAFQDAHCAQPSTVPVFVYLDAHERVLCPDGQAAPDVSAHSDSSSPWYQHITYGNEDGNNDIAAVMVTIYARAASNPSAPILTSQEMITLGQPTAHAPIDKTLPVVTDTTSPGAYQAGDTLTGTGWGDTYWDWAANTTGKNYSYQWCTSGTGSGTQGVCPAGYNTIPRETGIINSTNAGSATSSQYTLTTSDIDHTLRLVVTALSVYGGVYAISATTSKVTAG